MKSQIPPFLYNSRAGLCRTKSTPLPEILGTRMRSLRPRSGGRGRAWDLQQWLFTSEYSHCVAPVYVNILLLLSFSRLAVSLGRLLSPVVSIMYTWIVAGLAFHIRALFARYLTLIPPTLGLIPPRTHPCTSTCWMQRGGFYEIISSKTKTKKLGTDGQNFFPLSLGLLKTNDDFWRPFMTPN